MGVLPSARSSATRGAARPLRLGGLMERHRHGEDALDSLRRHMSHLSSDFLVTLSARLVIRRLSLSWFARS